MSEHRKIWYEAVRANQLMQIDQDEGQEEFNRLLELHPKDGMIFYERGEAYEALELWKPAEEDYVKAKEKFLFPNWQMVADLGINRIHEKQFQNYKYLERDDDQWSAFHLVHSLFKLPHDIRCKALSALERFDLEKDSCMGDFRYVIEELVDSICFKVGYIEKKERDKFLKFKIEWLAKRNLIDEGIFKLLKNINFWGSMTIHKKKINREIEPNQCISYFYKILDMMNGSKYFP